MRFLASKCQFLVIDVQEKLFPHMDDDLTLEFNLIKLFKGIQLLKIPTTVSEQYIKGLGKTLDIFQNELSEASFDEKNTFSCLDDAEIAPHLLSNKRNQIILCGIEAHVCVMQTAIDLIDKGFNVCVIVDAIGSRNNLDKNIAIQRMQQEGVYLATVESILFELCRDSKNPVFKDLSELIK
jgi:hypothetical protein